MNDILPLILIGCLWGRAGCAPGGGWKRCGGMPPCGCAPSFGCPPFFGYSQSCVCRTSCGFPPFGAGIPPFGGGYGGFDGRCAPPFDRDCGCRYRPHRGACLPF